MNPGWRLARTTAGHFFLYLIALVPLVLLLDVLDGGSSPAAAAAELAHLLAPLCAAAAAAVVVGSCRVAGVWDSWSLLGYSPASLLRPLVLVALLVAGFDAGGGFASTAEATTVGSSSVWDGAAPVDRAAVLWPSDDGWSRPDLSNWQVPPSELSTRELLRRLGQQAPPGSRSGVDRGELLRRLAWLVAWPFGVMFGSWRGLRCTPARARRRGSPVLRAAGETICGVLLALLSVLIAAAWWSGTM